MRIILSPAKKMNMDTDGLEPSALPVFLDRTEQILSYLRSKTPQELQTLWCCNDKIAEQNIMRLQRMDLQKNLLQQFFHMKALPISIWRHQYLNMTILIMFRSTLEFSQPSMVS